MQRTTSTFEFAATGTELTTLICENGYLTDYVLTVPNFTNNVTATLSILDDNDVTIWTGDAKARNATAVVNSLTVPVDRNFTLKCTLSGVAGGSGGDVVAQTFIQTAK